MRSLFYSLILACFTLSNAASVRSQNLDWSSDWQWPRKYPRYPPPPFDIEPAHRVPYDPRFPPSLPEPNPNVRTETTATTADNDDDQVVLYKAQCDPCLPGSGVNSMCNSTTNTVCTPCPLGTWSPRNHHYRPCVTCAKCGEGSYEEQACTTTRDTVCCSCANAKARVNEDYVRKCVLDTDSSKDIDVDIEFEDVMDVTSKEFEFYFDIDKSDSSDELPFNEDDIDRPFLWLPPKKEEIDITIDDPEIDEEGPKVNERVNEKTTVKPGSARILLHPVRPLPRMVPPMSERNIHVDPVEDNSDDDDDDLQAVNNFPPSYHEYSISSLVHGGDAQRRKAIVLLVLTCAIVLSTMAFVVCYVREYCRRRASNVYNGVTLVRLTREEREIMRKSAKALEEMEKPGKKSRNGYAQMGADEAAACGGIGNPLEDYLNTVDERHVARHGLIENEVTQEPRGDRKTVSA